MALVTDHTWGSPLGPSVARCIPPLPPIMELLPGTQEGYLKVYADRVVKQHLQTALVELACEQPACSICSACVLDLQDPANGERLAHAAWSSLTAAAASSPAQHHAATTPSSSNISGGGSGGGTSSNNSGTPLETLVAGAASFWPLTSPFRMPYASFDVFKQQCCQDLPALMLQLLSPKGGRPPGKGKQRQAQPAQQQQQAAVMGAACIQSLEWPFLTLVGQGSGGQSGSSSTTTTTTPPAAPGTRWALYVSTAQLRREVWCWALAAKDSWDNPPTARHGSAARPLKPSK